MKNLFIISAIALFVGSSFGQDFVMTFTPTDEANPIDSITARNIRTNEKITFTGDESLTLKFGSGIEQFEETAFNCIAYPNPFLHLTSILVIVPEPEELQLIVRNQPGQQVAQTEIFTEAGMHRFDLSLSTAGIYYVEVKSSKAQKLVQVVALEDVASNNQISYNGIAANPPAIESFKTGSNLPFLDFILGDGIVYTCYGGSNTTILSEEPRGSGEYPVTFYSCVDEDGKSYPVVSIGEQIWMANNLAYLPTVSPPDKGSTGSSNEPFYYVYGYEGSNVGAAKSNDNYKIYGVLYNYNAALTVCPSGWHLPNDEDWKTLEGFFGMSEADLESRNMRYSGQVGKKLKSIFGWNDDGNGIDKYGFNGLSAGWRNNAGEFLEMGIETGYLCSTVISEGWTLARFLTNVSDGIGSSGLINGLAFSVRCIKD